MGSNIIDLLIALLMGAAIGLERQSSNNGSHTLAGGGLRTFSLVALLGGISGIFYNQGMAWVFGVISLAFFALLVSHYALSVAKTRDFGMTTEIAFILTFTLAICLTTKILPSQAVIALGVLLILILSIKEKTKNLATGVNRGEIDSFISFAIIALVVLPFLPNQDYGIQQISGLKEFLEGAGLNLGPILDLDFLNPRKIWFVVVLITGIELFGYILSKIFGKKRGFALTSFIGGFISSTSTTQTLAVKSKAEGAVNQLVSMAVLANMASFFQIFLLIAPINSKWLIGLLPTLGIIITTSGLCALYLWRLDKNIPNGQIETENDKEIFSLLPALKFALLIASVKIVTSLSLAYFGQSGFLASSIIASFAGIDAILINLASMTGAQISFSFGILTFILVTATNLVSKSVYAFIMGGRKFALRFLSFTCIVIFMSLLGLII